MNKIYLLFVCCFMSLAASATNTYYPISVSAPYGGTAPSNICQNAANTATTVTYTNCGSVGAVGALTVTPTWYLNGALVYTGANVVIGAAGGTISLPAGAFTYSSFGSFTGANGLYCILSWSVGGTSPCGGVTSVQGASTDVNVNQTPTAIGGTNSVCTGNTTTLNSTPAGGVWSSSNTAMGTVNFSSGVVGGVGAGVLHISYTLGSGCAANTAFTVNQTPATITGTFNVCTGTLTTLHDVNAGGVWTSSNTAAGTIGSVTGGFNGLSTGVTTISYTMSSGCMTSTNVTVNQSPAVITGTQSVCSTDSTSLSDAVGGGIWTSSASSVASVNFSTGEVTGAGTSGTATITYTLTSGCKTNAIVTVNPLPAAISGSSSVCVGGLASLSDATLGGNWSTSNGNVSIGTGSGFITTTGSAPGLDTVYYTLSTGCSRSIVATVNPTPANITGTTVVCAGYTTALTDALTGGVWSSSTTSVATIAASGVATGVASGVTTITYKISATGCYTVTAVTVNSLPASITGATNLCVGSSTTLSDAITGGTWSTSSGGAIASIGSATGAIGGINPGVDMVTYTLATGCYKTMAFTVNAVPATISGATSVCIGTTTALTDVTIGGTWSSSTTAVATVSASGVVSGLSFGTTTISYKVSTGCSTQLIVSVNTNPSPISGITHLCLGTTTALTDASTGGNWSSSNPAVASVDVFGNVSGIAAGTATITYSIATGCRVTQSVTVNALPSAISGASAVCSGSTMTLSDITAGGTWSSTNAGLATVSGTGVVSGSTGTFGVDTINYTITATGCASSKTITINPVPAAITGTPLVCIGAITPLTDATASGIWSSNNPLRGTVDGAGNVTGIATGAVIISYTLSTGCQATMTVTVNTLPATINGLSTVCDSATITLSDATGGGTWSTSDPTIVTVSGTGLVTGTGVGSANIIYTLGTGCSRSTTISVNPLPAFISGTGSICVGSTTTLSDGVSGGVWSSGTTSVATIGFSTGILTGVAAGTSNITYTLGTGCKTVTLATVTSLPAVITGPTSVCIGSIITISDGTAGGTWSSADPTIGSIGVGTGIVTGVAAGTVTMTYTLATGCYRTVIINVNSFPSAISGASSGCVGSTIALSDPTAGGTWTSSTTTTATINLSTGVLTGVASGSTTITYTLSTGCSTTTPITINPLPAIITGATNVCAGLTTPLGDGSFPGIWSSANTTVASIDGSTGIVTGVAAGTATITFMLSTGCYKTTTVTVHQLPPAITGNTSMCVSTPTGLGDLTPGGTWSSSNLGVATINGAGLVTPASAGTTTITYTLTTGCYNTVTITVNPNPSLIAGASQVCAQDSTTLSDATSGGVWVSNNSTIATVGSSTGTVTGVIAGHVIISYVLSTGCNISTTFTVNPLPAPITGTTYLCQGTNTTLTDATAGGTWSSNNAAVATVTSGAVLGGISAGTATISYIPFTGCITSTVVTVNPQPAVITGRTNACTGDTTILYDATPGGQWISSNNAIGSIGTLSGILTGITQGNVTISYILGTGCYVTTLVSVSTTPAAISGPSNVCEGYSISLTDITAGGGWTSSDTTVATVGFASGFVVGQNISGPDTIRYTTGGVCTVYTVINVNQTPSVIHGITDVCTGYTNTLSNDIVGGTWTSSNSGKASVGLTTGVVTGISGGIVNISYTLGTGCYAYTPDTVNITPSPIMGATNVCPNLTITLSDAVSGGLWTSNNSSVAVVGGTTGVVTGNSSGTAVISYIVGTGCGVATTINVNPAPPAISGSLNFCAGFTSTLSDAATGGVWISSNTSVATIGLTSGIVSGITTGTTIITYKLLATGCQDTSTAAVNPIPGPILGLSNVCVGSTINLSDTTSFGTWSSSNTAVATIGSITGDVYGLDSGYTTITYTSITGCIRTSLIRVNMVPAAIFGSDSLCPGVITTFSDVTPFGTWISNDTSVIAVIDGVTGNLTGVVPGTTVITYLLGTGCYATQQVTVNPLPAAIVGSPIVCVGATLFMSDATSGGVWSSTNSAVGSIDNAGNVTGISPGYDTLTYTLSTGCSVSHFITVSATSSPILGDTVLCVGSIDTLTSTPPGGTWSSSNVTIGSIGSATGYLTGVTPGFVVATYTTLSGCRTNFSVTINPVPSPITGINNLCPGGSTTLFDPNVGGVWSSTNSAAAPISPTTGSTTTVSAILAGQVSTISYTISNGCAATMQFSVNPLPYVGTIGGIKVFCMSSTTALSDSVAGGVWSSNNTSVATIGSDGVVSGLTVGTATISYIVTEQCGMDTATTTIQVKPLPYAGPIQGSAQMCLHFNTTLTDSLPGGIWKSTDTAIASIDSVTGIVYGVNAGTAVISYTYTNSCGSATANTMVTVNATFGFARIVTAPDTPLCSNTLFQNFGALLPEPTGIAYHWSVIPSGDSVMATGINGQYSIINFHTPGTATVILSAEVLSSGCIVSDSLPFNIGSSVTPRLNVQYYLSEFVCADNTQDSYQWGYDDILTMDSTILIGENNQSYYNAHPDTLRKNYWVMTTKNGCLQKTYYTFNLTTGVSNLPENNLEVNVFPNPADSRVNIVVKGLKGADKIEVKLMDMFGKEIQTSELLNGKGALQVSELPSGVYSVLILNDGIKIGSKVFVKN